MTKNEICRYYPTIAYCGLCGLEVKHIEYEPDYLYCVSDAGHSEKHFHRLKLYVDRNGQDYIIFNGRKRYLHDFVSFSNEFGDANR